MTADRELEERFAELEESGYEVTICKTVMTATVLVEELSPRVVFIDIKTRGARDFVRWLKKETGCGTIALLGDARQDDYPVTGFDGWLRPPYCEESVLKVLSESGIQSGEIKNCTVGEGFWDITNEIRATFETEDGEEEYGNLPSKEPKYGDIHVINQEVISIWSAKGGVGRTTFAIQVARYLSDFDVLLIDLNFKEGPGDINTILDLPAAPHLGKLLEEKNDRRRGFMDSLIKPKDGPYAIIQPPPTIDQSEQITPDDIIELIDQARRCFQIIIIDLPSDLSPVTLEALDLSTVVLFVSDSSLGSLARIESIKSFVRKDIVKALVLNMFNAGAHKAKELSYFLDIPLATLIQDCRQRKERKITGNIKKDCDSIFGKGVVEIVEAVFGIKAQNERARTGIGRLIKGAISNIIG